MQISTNLEEYGEMTPLFKLDENIAMVRNVGSYIAILTYSGKLMFFDENLIHLCTLLPFNEDETFEEIMDFEFLNGDFAEFNQDMKILFKVKTTTGIKVS